MGELKKIREKANMTQEELARRVGVGQSTVAMWENGHSFPRASMLVKLCGILSCSTDELLGIKAGA